MNSLFLPLLIGILVAVINGMFTLKISRNHVTGFYTALMAATAAVYVGSALASGSTRLLTVETAIATVLFAMVLAGFWRSLMFTAVAFFLHGIWDMLHAWWNAGASAGHNYPVFCLAFDWVIACFIVYLETRSGKRSTGGLPPA